MKCKMTDMLKNYIDDNTDHDLDYRDVKSFLGKGKIISIQKVFIIQSIKNYKKSKSKLEKYQNQIVNRSENKIPGKSDNITSQ